MHTVMFWMRANPLRGQVEGGWALEFQSFLGPVKWHQADRRVPLGPKNLRLLILLYYLYSVLCIVYYRHEGKTAKENNGLNLL
jgi:hypothetical protein